MSKINDYAKFVDTTTSRESKNFMAFIRVYFIFMYSKYITIMKLLWIF